MNLKPLKPEAPEGYQPLGAVLTDLTALGAPASDGQFIVATGAGVFAYESGNTARTSLGLGTGDSPIFAGQTITGNSVFGLNSSVFQPTTDSTTFFQILDTDGGTPVFNVDTINEIVSSPTFNALDEDNALQIDGTTILRTGTAANFNIFVGEDSFSGLPGGITKAQNEGTRNTGVGYHAGLNNDSSGGGNRGFYNVYIGYEAGAGLTEGTSNSGYFNFGLGKGVLRKNTTGNANVGIGYNVLVANTTGFQNIAIGIQALEKNQIGFSNFGMGLRALHENVSGDQNIAIGDYALYYMTANYNTCIGGGFAGWYNQTGQYNTLIGYQVGRGVINNSYSNNTLIGSQAGYTLETGSDNIYIGYKSGYRQTTLSDRLIIDNQDRGSAAAEITDCLIYGVFHATPASQSLRFNADSITQGNPTHSDADGGGATQQIFIREQSGGEATSMFQFEASHDGTSDDQLGKGVWSVNTGSGLVQALEIGSDLLATFAGAVSITGAVSAGSFTGLVIGTDIQAHSAALDDLHNVGTVGADSEFLVGTGAGALAWENATTARTSIGLGNVENIALSTWAGTTNITTLGTIATVGNITIANGGTIGQAAGLLLTFNDTDNLLEVTGGNLEITGTTAGVIKATRITAVTNSLVLINRWIAKSSGDMTAGFGPSFNLYIEDTAEVRNVIAAFGAARETGGDRFGAFVIHTANGGALVERMRVGAPGGLFLKEQAAAGSDIAAYGQIWIKNDAPNTLWFTDNTGVDHQIAFV